MKKTFEENDAGFQYVIDRKGIQAYDIHNQLFDQKVTSTKNNDECAGILNEWLQFFRKGHIGIEILTNDLPENTQKTIQTFPDWEKMEVDTTAFKKYLDTKKYFDLEGIWQDGVYTIGIKKIDDQFVGFIIDSQAEEWEKGQVKFRIYPDSVLFYMRDHSVNKLKQAYLASRNLLFFDNLFNFWRTFPVSDDKFLNSLAKLEPHLEQLDSSTLYLQIPSFNAKELIDSILVENEEKILSCQNLIIDLRYNGGGDDGSWQKLLSFIQTNPVRQRSVYYLSSEMNNQILEKYRGNNFKKRLDSNLGKFVLLHSEEYYTLQFDTIYSNPKQIAILANKYCASSTEQFLLAAKQSHKVRIFGTVTNGALDFSNLNRIESPCGDFKLHYAMSKDVDMEDYPIDNIGIQPDFYLDNSIPEYQWVDYVRSILDYDRQ